MYNNFNKEILRHHYDNQELYLGRVPFLYRKFKTGGLVCVGINPSFPEHQKAVQEVCKFLNKHSSNDRPPIITGVAEFVSLHEASELKSDDVEKILSIQDVYRENYSYYKQFRALADYVGLELQELEVFQVRETAQKKLIKHLDANPEFALRSVELFIKMLDVCNPRAIIIANAGAVKFLCEFAPNLFPIIQTGGKDEQVGLSAPVDAKIGTHLYRGKVPLFYTSMLTGQRALDTGSRQRLFWHVDYAIKQNSH